MKVKILGAHNTESKSNKLMCLLIDDILALDAGNLASSLSFRSQMKLKGLFLTHAHYDHIRDVPALAMNFFLRQKTLDIYTHQAVSENLTQYFLNKVIYPDFHNRPPENPTLKIHLLEPYQSMEFEGYQIMAAPVNHALPAMGFQITSPDNKVIFYTGDTGSGLTELWKRITPQVLFIELTALNRYEDSMVRNKHLDSRLLEQELIHFRGIHGYLPRVIAIHINPADENKIKQEAAVVSESLGIQIEFAHEGMQIQV